MSLSELSNTSRTELHRHRERGRTDRDDLYAVLDAGLICHLGVIADGAPRVLPTGYGRVGDTLYLHGSSANGTFMAGAGREVCVTVTHLDGLVCARSVFNHSMNYRSAMIYGVTRLLIDPAERTEALRVITEHLAPGTLRGRPDAREHGAIGGGLRGRSLAADQRDLVRQWCRGDGVVVLDQLALAPQRSAEISAGPGGAERLCEATVREHDQEHVLDRREVAEPSRGRGVGAGGWGR